MLSRGRLTSPPLSACIRPFYPSRKRKNALHSRNIILNPSFVTFKQAENILMSYSLGQGVINAWWVRVQGERGESIHFTFAYLEDCLNHAFEA